jgi:alpha-galactosidase
MKVTTIILLLTLISLKVFSQSSGNLLPPMGWEPWNIDHCGNSSKWDAEYYMKLADFFVSCGLKDLGYVYLTIECGDHYRDVNGRLQPNLSKFPDGFKPVIDYIHKKGLKVRTYTDAGKGKCCCFEGEGSLGHYEDDARSWVEWGFDGVKIDWCGGYRLLDPNTQFLQFADSIRKVSKSFLIEICSWGFGEPWNWGKDAGSMWRTGGDIDLGKKLYVPGGAWILLLRNREANNHPDPHLVGPGKGWNYPDMLLIGHPEGLSETEEKSMFSMWAIMASPLFLGNDVMNMPEYVKSVIMNKDVIAIDQDPLGIQGEPVPEFANGTQVWLKELNGGSKAIAVLNRGEKTDKITLNWKILDIPGTLMQLK